MLVGRRLIPLAVLFLCVRGLAAACPEEEPTDAVLLAEPACGTLTACPEGAITFRLRPEASGFFPPAEPDHGYTIQPCDVVTWSFGDGTTQDVTGSNEVTHVFAEPGNYTIGVTITNALGSASRIVRPSLVVADSPSRITVHTVGYRECSTCVRAVENAGSVTIDLIRSLDTSRTVSVQVSTVGTEPGVPPFSGTVTFAPGETLKTVTVPLVDDALYYGPRYYPIQLTAASGGVLPAEATLTPPTLMIVDNEDPPVVSAPATASVVEGSGGLTTYTIPVQMSAPMLLDVSTAVFLNFGTATVADIGERPASLRIPAGETTGIITGSVRGDFVFEGDESFVVRIFPRDTNNDPAFGNLETVVTIVDDESHDAASVPLFGPAGTLIFAGLLALLALRTLRA
ncbi:MAG TPA: PKD domain-containing protein [Thermoanaerobaculia bacterium]|jgi:PKD repeat protein